MRIAVLGGDGRFEHLRQLLQQRGFVLQQDVSRAAAVILPLPALDGEGRIRGTALTADALLAQLQQQTLLLGGQLPAAFLQKAAARQLTARDYYLDEQLLLQNAAATAEGALALLIENLPVVLRGSRIAVIGYGRIGSRLAQLLQALGAAVTVFARSEASRQSATAAGHTACPMQQLGKERFAAFCNTVPAPIMREEELAAVCGQTLWLELASVPGGLCRCGAESGVHVLPAQGLPGRFSPHSAAEWILDAVMRILSREGYHA